MGRDASSNLLVKYRFYSSETELANNIVKVSLYFPEIDSTFALICNPDSAVNSIQLKKAQGQVLSAFPTTGFQDISHYVVIDDKNVQVGSNLTIDSSNTFLQKAIAISLPYTSEPVIIGTEIEPVEPTGGSFRITIRRGRGNAIEAAANHCVPSILFQKDGESHIGNIYIIRGHCLGEG